MSRRKGESFSKDYIYDAILQLFTTNKDQLFNYKQIVSMLGIGSNRKLKGAFDTALFKLLQTGAIEEIGRGKYHYRHIETVNSVGEVVAMNGSVGFVKVDGMDEDVIVFRENMEKVLVGDKVELSIYASIRREGRMEGVVNNIVERTNRKYVGVAQITRSSAFVCSDSRNMPYDIYIPSNKLGSVVDGDKVLCRVTSWGEDDKNPTGEIIDILGKEGDNDTEMHAILAEYDLPYHFPESVSAAAEHISSEITSHDEATRRDFRDITTFTIDPKDAKDFDDALSVRKVGDEWEVGVHIADVTRYVLPGDTVDKEAVQRATSVYLVDRTIPMLPERLSNGLCSLRPNETKLCFSAVFTLDSEANVTSEWIGRTIIHSDRRFTYEEAQEVIETGEGDFASEILTLNDLAKKIREQRFKSGSIAFDRDEVKFVLDEKGRPTGVYFKQHKESNHLIEEFMLLANKKVAEFIAKKSGRRKAPTFVYRIHDKPSTEKFGDFCSFIAKFGYNLNAKSDKGIAKQINKLLADIKGKNVENLFSTLAIRTMAKAVYSTHNIGHYGLAFDHYSHFTSPIRRYPDMMVHRLLQHYLDGGKSVNQDEYEDMCEHSSAMEIRASEAERASIKYKMVEYMAERLGQEFVGSISGVTEWGVYVTLDDSNIEGMVALRDMKDDYYDFDEKNYRVIGQRRRKIITLGDKVRVSVLRTDLKRKQLDFELISLIDFDSGHEQRLIEEPKKRKKGRR